MSLTEEERWAIVHCENDDFQIVQTEGGEMGCDTQWNDIVFKQVSTGKFFAISAEYPLTEAQEGIKCDITELVEVQRKEKMVIVYE